MSALFSPAASSPTVDHTALRVNQASIVLVAALAFLLNVPLLVALLFLAMAVGTAVPSLAPFKALYARVLRPAGLLRPDPRPDDPAPHQFAQGLGAVVLGIAIVTFLAGATALGWALTGLVALLAAVNLLAGFCLGCYIYYQLARRGLLPGQPDGVPQPTIPKTD